MKPFESMNLSMLVNLLRGEHGIIDLRWNGKQIVIRVDREYFDALILVYGICPDLVFENGPILWFRASDDLKIVCKKKIELNPRR